jgi:uncharacterized membrane protein
VYYYHSVILQYIAAQGICRKFHTEIAGWDVSMMVVNVVVLQFMLTNGFLHSDAARYERGMRMSALAREIREEYARSKVDEEIAENTEQNLTWWLENLVSRGSDEQKANEEVERKIKSMLKYSSLYN